MFGRRYFGGRYFGPRYFGDGGAAEVVNEGGGSGRKIIKPGQKRGKYFSMWRDKRPEDYEDYEAFQRRAMGLPDPVEVVAPIVIPEKAPQKPRPTIVAPPIDVGAVAAASMTELRQQIRFDLRHASQAYQDFYDGLIIAEQQRMQVLAMEELERQRIELQQFIEDDEAAIEILLLM